MNSIFHSTLRLPSVSRFMDNALLQLRDGVSAVFLLPKTIPIVDFQLELRSEFSLRRIDYQDIDLYEDKANVSPVSCLCRAINTRWRDPMAPRVINQMPDSCIINGPLPDVLWIIGLESQSTETIEKWISASQEWAESGKIYRDRGERLPSICIALPASKCNRAPMSEIFFKIHYWWGIPSLLETRLLCTETDWFSLEAISWRECIVPHLCAGDLFLLPHLSKSNSLDEKEIGSALMEVAKQRGWTRDFLISKGAKELISMNQSLIMRDKVPSFAPLFSLWSEGIVNNNPGMGLCFSSPALYVMGRHAEIRHRLWCGQSELVMPMLNVMRLAICNYLTKKFGQGWPVMHVEPQDPQEATAVHEDPTNCQFGHLEMVLHNWPGRHKTLRSFAGLLKVARLFRNEIAHNRTITFADFQDLWESTEKTMLLLHEESATH